jgi:hypothetical protein
MNVRKKNTQFSYEGRSDSLRSELVAKKEDETKQRNSFKWFLRTIKYGLELEFYLLIPSTVAKMSAAIKCNSQNTHFLLPLITVLKQEVRRYFNLNYPPATDNTYRTYK